jgi:mannose-6-phosphate isomerase-like protein (cupin superfamily)
VRCQRVMGEIFSTGRSQAHVKIEFVEGRSFAVFEAPQTPGVLGPPQHVHKNHDEAWYIIEGQMEFRLDDDTYACPVGSVVFAPRGTVHTFHNPGPEVARVLSIVTAQALPLVEGLGQLAAEGPPDAAAVRSLLGEHETYIVDRV